MDRNAYSFYALEDFELSDRMFLPEAVGMKRTETEDTAKFSRCKRGKIVRFTSFGGLENANDVNNHCEDLLFENGSFIGGEQAAIVVKGRSRNIVYRHVSIKRSRHSRIDVLWDDYSDQSKEYSTGVLDQVYTPDGSPVRLAFGRYHRPQITPGTKVRIIWW
ncbi:MAG: hypothetical protein SFV32_12835 [Opitutaceae bacterium]|nr:hypothetical protein [Opitutaceae bacterium]